MASLMLRNTVPEEDRTDDPGRHGGIAVRRDTTLVDDTQNGSRKSRLDLVIEAEIIPRLMVAHSVSVGRETYQDPPLVSTLENVDIDDFARMVIRSDVSVAYSFIDALRAQGLELESVFLDVLTPAARRLGVMWEEDTVNFADVTVGLSKLQQILRELSPNTNTAADENFTGNRALLASVPGDQHTFGVFMVEEFFRRAGWDVVTCVLESSEELAELVGVERFDVVGFSTSRDDLLEQLADDVRRLYRVSKNPDIRIVVGGRCFRDDPALVQKVGADGTAADGREAVSLASTLVGAVKSSR